MRVSTPAITLAVDIESSCVEDGKIKLTGMASTLQCDVTLKPREVFLMARLFLKPGIIKVCLASLFKRADS
jgi:hypothetical protein